MTVSYMRDAANADAITFIRLLFRWKGSVWKAIHPELFTWLFCFILISGTYRFVLRGTDAGVKFESIVKSTSGYLNRVSSSLNFVLGFYVSYVATRWWWTFLQLPWPDNFFGQLSGFFQSKGPKFKIPSVLTREELKVIQRINDSEPELTRTCLYWIPVDWIMKLLKNSVENGNLSDLHYTVLVEDVARLRQSLNNLLSQDFLCSTPLSYTQVASIAPLIYFLMCLIGRQYIDPKNPDDYTLDYYFPIYTIYEFVVYFGWLKVAQTMLNPFGLDDDDYEIDFLVQRNYEHGNLVLDRIYEHIPESVTVELKKLPVANANVERMIGSTAKVKLTEEDAAIMPNHIQANNKFTHETCLQDFPKFTGNIVPNFPGEKSPKAEQKEKQKKENPPSKIPALTERMDVSDKTQLNAPTIQQSLGIQLDDTQRSQSVFQRHRNT